MRLITLLFFILHGFSCFAQLGLIQGEVVDPETEELIHFVSVSLYEKDSLIDLTQTDTTGFFQLDSIQSGYYDLRLSYLGYPDSTISAIKVQEDTTELRIAYATYPPCPPYNKDQCCPVCHKRDKRIPVKYGVPTRRMKRRAKRGKIKLGLCNYPYCDPHWYCKRDSTYF